MDSKESATTTPCTTAPADLVKKIIKTGGLGSVLLGVSGFLAVRAAIGGLGIPAYAEVSTDTYLQFGGRFVFTFAVHLMLISAVLYLAFLLVCLLVKLIPSLRRLAGSPYLWGSAILAISLFGLTLELVVLDTPPLFGHQLPDPWATSEDIAGVMLFLIETASVAALVCLATTWRRLWDNFKPRIPLIPLLPVLGILVAVQVTLVPLCFGKVWICPREFPEVTLQIESKCSAAKTGFLIYRDDSDYFIWTSENTLFQTPRGGVREIRYGKHQHIREIRGS